MNMLLNAIAKVIRRPAEDRDDSAERFLARCENFRLLLAANNQALETMAEMTEDANSGQVFGMARVRAHCLKVAAGVRQMIERLCRMKPGRYDALKDVFNRIVVEMDQAMVEESVAGTGALILGLDRIGAGDAERTGSKMAMLGEVRAALGVRVPRGFCITASAFRQFMEHGDLDDEIHRLIQIHPGQDFQTLRGLEESIGQAVSLAPMPSALDAALNEALRETFGDERVRLALRSSALGEDSEEASFAGQFLSVLGVAPKDVAEAYRAVVSSMFSARSMGYRLSLGLREDGLVMCVGCMEMIDAVAGGVAYTRDPLGAHHDGVVVSGVPGLPKDVVDGSVPTDNWVVGRRSRKIRRADIATKSVRSVLVSGEVRRQVLSPEEGAVPCLTDAQVKEIASSALDMEAHFGGPQDVEWAVDRQGRLYILQCRPLALLDRDADSDRPADPAADPDRGLALISDGLKASPGVGAGRPFLIRGDDDMGRFPDGGVVLARAARPELSVLLPRAAAVVAEHGSATGHLANVAREYGVPAIIGAPGAVDRLADAPLITVNADRGTVYLGRRENQLEQAAATRRKVAETEVARALRRVLPLVTPLNLTDPTAPEFAPAHCATLHDITRYCHEMGVAEMFREGKMPSTSARQLRDQGLLQYWLVDIGGGVADSGGGPVHLSDVRSNAMCAVWTGMTAVEWEGPPPVNAGGFMSVLAESAMTPGLAPGMATEMAERNYFIVGENYCNLQSRFGFHFCTVEGFAGDDQERNFAFFQFKGGGADKGRRTVRAALVGEILEQYGFTAEVRDDALFARMEGVPRGRVERGLAVAGYMVVHTRQIDMAMGEPGARERYRAKFGSDLARIVSEYDGGGQ